MYPCVPDICLVCVEARKGHKVPQRKELQMVGAAMCKSTYLSPFLHIVKQFLVDIG